MFPFYIARHFMLGGKGAGPSRLTGWIAILGLTIGTMAMVLSISVLNGFETRVIQRIVGFEGDLRISGFPEVDKERIQGFLSAQTEVNKSVLFQERRGLIMGRQESQRMVSFKALELDAVTSFYDLNLTILDEYSTLPKIYLGEMIARRLNVSLGDGVRIMSPIDQGGGFGIPRQILCIVGGIFHVEVLDVDDYLVFIPAEIGRNLFLRKQGPDGIDIRLGLSDSADYMKKILNEEFPGFKVETWRDLHKDLFGAMRLERLGALIVLSLIIVVACFNLVSTLALVTAQKIREYGILQTLGTTQKRIQAIILTQGALIGGLGSISGLILGIGIVITQNIFGFIPLPEDVYFTNTLPMDLFARDIMGILIITLGMITLASYTAARRALAIHPKDAVYTEK